MNQETDTLPRVENSKDTPAKYISADSDPCSLEERRAKNILDDKLAAVSARRESYSAICTDLRVGRTSVAFTLSIRGPAVWQKTLGTKDALEARLREAIQGKYGGAVSVTVREGSLTIAIVASAMDALNHLYQLVQSVVTISEYVIRCFEQDKLTWPPIAAMFTMWDAIKSLFLGL